MADNTNDTTCVVCFKNVVYYSIGECDHPVCYECSTRMRVLCLQNECPICRQGLSRVVFTDTVRPYKELRNQVFTDKQFERQFKIGFSNDDIKRAYEQLLENHCRECDKLPPFRSFSALSDHMRKVHERYYCDLCVKHLRIFTSERRCYTRQELAHHRRKGDVDDTSHRGHPLCEFCEERFMDADELYRHLRKEHLYCHLCDADGRNHYYASHTALAHHFRTDHYLCEEGDCAGQHLTAVFRSEIDLIAHKASVHGGGLTRAAARQARTLELQFNITPHPVAQRQPNARDRDRAPPPPPAAAPAPAPSVDPASETHFPRLSAAAAPPQPLHAGGTHKGYNSNGGLARTDRNFPTLGGGPAPRPPAQTKPQQAAAAAVLRNSKPSVSIQLQTQPTSAQNFRITQPTGARISAPAPRRDVCEDEYPTLGGGRDDHPSLGAGTVQPPKVALINSQEMQALKKSKSSQQMKKPQLSSEAFPALSASAAPAAPPQWIKIAKTKEKPKPAKTSSPPKEPNFNPTSGFPGLPVNNKPKPKKTAPAPQIPKTAPAPQIPSSQYAVTIVGTPATNNKSAKKDKKNNTKKENLADDIDFNFADDKQLVREARDASASQVLANMNNNQTVSVNEQKLKTMEQTVPEKNRNGGNGDFAFKAKDYPALGGRDTKPVSTKMPAQTMASKIMASKPVANGVPPGFTKPRPACDGMTFTNSSGQQFSAPLHSYIPPPEFESRNHALVKKFAVALGGTAAVENFKVASRAFRDSIINAEEFYQHCETALGPQLDEVFPELVALLPDIAKQQELVVGRKAGSQLDVCSVCGQLLAPDDRVGHDTTHWPPLSGR